MDDDELMAAMAGGDDTAPREPFARHAPWLAARLRFILPAAEIAWFAARVPEGMS